MTHNPNYIAAFAEPKLGREHRLDNGLDILVSARLLEEGTPFDKITDLDLWNDEGKVDPKSPALLLIEARDAEQPKVCKIAHCVLRLSGDRLDLIEADVLYAYRDDEIIEALVALAGRFTGEPMADVPQEGHCRV